MENIISQVHVLVYPFWADAMELYLPTGRRKYEQWVKQVEAAGKRKDTLFVIIHDSPPTGASKALETEFRKILTKNISGRFFEVLKANVRSFLVAKNPLGNFLKRVSSTCKFAPKIEVKYYGQHLDSCNREMGLMAVDKLQAGLNGAKISAQEIRGLSLKEDITGLARLVARKSGNTTKAGASAAEIQSYRVALANYRAKGMNPVQLAHIVKSAKGFQEVVDRVRATPHRRK
ncbi:MAG: hypothetical protein WCW13_02345 [archaeon]|jgi:hypothetical protein